MTTDQVLTGVSLILVLAVGSQGHHRGLDESTVHLDPDSRRALTRTCYARPGTEV